MNKINKKELHQIFQELREKNQNAYNELYEKYYKLVYGIVFSIMKNKADAEDVTHEIFTKIYKLDVNKFPTDHEASWLFTVSKNECLLYIRKLKPNISLEEIYEMTESNNGIEEVIDKDYYNKLISGLKEDEKIIVSLKILSNFTFKKISQVMNIPIGTVQWKYYNAINSLKISIGSLAGAILAFIFVIGRGELWKKEEHNSEIYNKENDIQNEQENQNNISQNEFTDSQVNIDNTEKNDLTPSNSIIETTGIGYKEEINNKMDNNFDTIQLIGITVGIMFFIIFIIFFKKYQQKLKNKSSK